MSADRIAESFCTNPLIRNLLSILQTGAMFGLPGRGILGSFELLRAGSLNFPGAPDLALGRLIGRGSFGSFYKGAPSAPPPQAGVLSHTCQWRGDL